MRSVCRDAAWLPTVYVVLLTSNKLPVPWHGRFLRSFPVNAGWPQLSRRYILDVIPRDLVQFGRMKPSFRRYTSVSTSVAFLIHLVAASRDA